MASLIVFTNERHPPGVEVEPRLRLRAWRIFRSAEGKFFIGAELSGGTIRLTSALLRMDFIAGIATTSSGRQYELCEPPTVDRVSQQLITANALRRGLHGATDVSDLWWLALMHGLDVLPEADLANVLMPATGTAQDEDQGRPNPPS